MMLNCAHLANACDTNSSVLFMHAISLLHIIFGLELKMVRWKASEFIQDLEFEFLRQNCSHRRIQKALKEIGPSVSLASIHCIPHATYYIVMTSLNRENPGLSKNGILLLLGRSLVKQGNLIT